MTENTNYYIEYEKNNVKIIRRSDESVITTLENPTTCEIVNTGTRDYFFGRSDGYNIIVDLCTSNIFDEIDSGASSNIIWDGLYGASTNENILLIKEHNINNNYIQFYSLYDFSDFPKTVTKINITNLENILVPEDSELRMYHFGNDDLIHEINNDNILNMYYGEEHIGFIDLNQIILNNPKRNNTYICNDYEEYEEYEEYEKYEEEPIKYNQEYVEKSDEESDEESDE